MFVYAPDCVASVCADACTSRPSAASEEGANFAEIQRRTLDNILLLLRRSFFGVYLNPYRECVFSLHTHDHTHTQTHTRTRATHFKLDALKTAAAAAQSCACSTLKPVSSFVDVFVVVALVARPTAR